MVVRFDQARHHRHLRQIDHLRTGGNRHVGPDLADACAFDQDDLVGEEAAPFGLEQASGADGGDGRRRLCLCENVSA